MSPKTMMIGTNEVTLETLDVNIKMIRIGRRQLTLSIFRQFYKESIIDEYTGALQGVPLSRVNYFWGGCSSSDHYHILWQKGEELRRDCVRNLSKNGRGWRKAQGLVDFDDLIEIAQKELFCYVACAIAARLVVYGSYHYHPQDHEQLCHTIGSVRYWIDYSYHGRKKNEEWWPFEDSGAALARQRYGLDTDALKARRETKHLFDKTVSDNYRLFHADRYQQMPAGFILLRDQSFIKYSYESRGEPHREETEAEHHARVDAHLEGRKDLIWRECRLMLEALGHSPDEKYSLDQIDQFIKSKEAEIESLKTRQNVLALRLRGAYETIKNLEHHFIAG